MTKTHIWITSKGQKIPVELLEDKHLKTAWKLCWLVVYFYQRHSKPASIQAKQTIPKYAGKTAEECISMMLESNYDIKLDFTTASKFSVILEQEIIHRGKKWKRPEYGKLSLYLKTREDSKAFLKERFDNTINYSHREPKY